LRIATYNVHGFVGTDGRRDVSRVAEVVLELDASIVALQEVAFPIEDGSADPVDLLATLTHFQSVSAPIFRADGVRHGNALLTSLPIRKSQVISLDFDRFEPRRVLDVTIDAFGHDLRVLSTHLGLRPRERRFQVKKLLELLQDGPRSHATLLLGDFNEWFLAGRPLRWLEGHFGRCAAVPTFPSRWPIFALDRIWSNPRHAIADSWAHRSTMSQVASDHLPAVAELRVPVQ
jgi:endonuclease/exonuclease/phosphatase family metal-dependent hydrolase